MPADARPRVSSRLIEKNLHTLYRYGLTTRRFDLIGDLLAVARRLSDQPTDAEKVEDVLTRAVNVYEQPTLDVVRLWFGLATDNPALPVTRDMKPPERTRIACGYWLRDVETTISAHTFKTHRVKGFYETLARRLANGELAAAEPSTNDLPPAQEQNEATTGSDKSAIIVREPIDVDSIDTNDPAVIDIVRELRAASELGVQTAAEQQRFRLLGVLAATAVSDNRTPLEKLEALLLWGIDETETDRLRREGMVLLFELGPVRPVPWMSERRPLALRYLRPNSLTRRDRYDWGSEEGATFTRLARLFTALAIQHRVHAPSV